MHELSNRQREIIECLLKNGHLSGANLGQRLGISDKTVRNDIHLINDTFESAVICFDQNGFYILSNATEEMIRMMRKSTYDIERKLLRYLLLKNKSNEFYDIAEIFYLSPSALQSKVKKINEHIQKYNLEIIRTNSKLSISGNQYNRQKLYLDLLHQDAGQMFHDINDYAEYFPGINIDHAIQVIKKSVEEQNCYIPPYYENNLIINILTIISLYKDQPESLSQSFDNSAETLIASNIVNSLFPFCSERNDLINMIRYCLTGIIRPQNNGTELNKPYSKEFINQLLNVVRCVFDNYGIHAETSQFMMFFPDHVYNLIHRLQNGNYISFPQNISMQTNCMYIYDVAVYLCEQLNLTFHIEIPADEISLIAMHIGFAIESYFSIEQRINILLNVGGYPIVEKTITKALLEKYEDKINLFKTEDIEKANGSIKIDLIITTFPCFHKDNTQYCQISPFLTDNDKNLIEHSITECLEYKYSLKFDKLIMECFDSNLFFINENIHNRDDAIILLNDSLLKYQIVGESFLSSVFYRESLNPTCFMNIFAIPHSFHADANKDRIAVLINKNGISWDTQTVKIVFLIAISKDHSDSQKIILDGLGKMLSNSKTMTNLFDIDNYSDFISLITKQIMK